MLKISKNAPFWSILDMHHSIIIFYLFRKMDSIYFETVTDLVTWSTLKNTSGLTVKSALLRSALHNRWPHRCCSCCENGQVKFWLTPSALLMLCMTSKKTSLWKIVRKKSQVIVNYRCGTTYVKVQGTILITRW